MAKALKIGIVAGEVSGDAHAAFLIHRLCSMYPNAVFEGVGGPKMKKAGCRCLYSIDDLSFMGITDVFLHLPSILNIRRKLIKHFKKQPIDLFIGVDFPDFNLSIEAALKKASIKVVHYISPTIWAWRAGRIKKIRRAVDLMLGIYPFEKKFYKHENVDFYFIGHPLTRQIKGPFDMAAKRKLLGLNEQRKLLVILPGSRSREIQYLAKPFILTAKQCMQYDSKLDCIVALTDDVHAKQFKTIWEHVAPNVPLKIVTGQTYSALEAADVVLLASGTATLETLLFEKPMVVAYRVDWFSYWVGRIMLYVKHIALPNILASASLVPEFIQNDVTVINLTNAVMPYLRDPQKNKSLVEQYRHVRQALEENIDPDIISSVFKKLMGHRHPPRKRGLGSVLNTERRRKDTERRNGVRKR